MNRNGVMLFLNLLFISGFYLLINVQWTEVALPLLWIFVPSTVTVSLFFYRFNTLWLKQKFAVDRFLPILPIAVLVIATILELLNYSDPESINIQSARVLFTVVTMKYLFPAFGGLIIALNFFKVRMEEQSNKDAYADHLVVNLNWCYASLAFYTLFFVGVILSEIVNPWVSELLFNGSLLALTLYLGYYQIKVVAQYLKSTRIEIVSENVVDNLDEDLTNSSESEGVEKGKKLFEQLEILVNAEKLYLKPDLTIHELGLKLELNSKYLSQAINQQEELNFNKYINQKRIKHAQELLVNSNYANFSLEGIGNESGFRSKSTFNTTFKTITGNTPSEYRKKGSQQS